MVTMDGTVAFAIALAIGLYWQFGTTRGQARWRALRQPAAVRARHHAAGAADQHSCPSCSSSKIYRVGLGRKAAWTVGLGLLAAGTVVNRWHCRYCGYRW